jgi:hypothetical protein
MGIFGVLMLLGVYNLISQMRGYDQENINKQKTGEAILQILSSICPTSHDDALLLIFEFVSL